MEYAGFRFSLIKNRNILLFQLMFINTQASLYMCVCKEDFIINWIWPKTKYVKIYTPLPTVSLIFA